MRINLVIVLLTNVILPLFAVEPSFYSTNQYMIGLMHLKLGNKAQAKEWFEKLLNFDVIKDEDKQVIVVLLLLSLVLSSLSIVIYFNDFH